MDFDLALIGFGEAAGSFALAAGWRQRATAFDRKQDQAACIADAKRADYRARGVVEARDGPAAAAAANFVLALVTADQALDAARAAARSIRPGALYCDGNSVAPGTKRKAARMIEEAGGRYVDMAIMAPVQPARLSVPILLSGSAAPEARAALADLGFEKIRTVGAGIGRASSIKMVRSIMVKGLEALTAECLLAAARADVLDEVLASLDASERAALWRERADYDLDRMLVHGERRAAEMEEVVKTLRDLGLGPALSLGTVARQRAIGALGEGRPPDGLVAKLALIEGNGSSKGDDAA